MRGLDDSQPRCLWCMWADEANELGQCVMYMYVKKERERAREREICMA